MNTVYQAAAVVAILPAAHLIDYALARFDLWLESRRPSLAEQLQLVEAPVAVPAGAPTDPESLDWSRPFDIDVCPVCMGEGAVMHQYDPYAPEFDSVECVPCAGTGQRGAE